MQRKYWPLLALWAAPADDASSSAKRLTPTQLQKALFVFGQLRNGVVGEFYQFIPYHYGPFAPDIEHDLHALQEEQYVAHVGKPREFEWEITLAGSQLGTQLAETIDPEALAYLSRLTKWIRSVPRSVLLRAVYDRFPEFKRRGNAVPDE